MRPAAVLLYSAATILAATQAAQSNRQAAAEHRTTDHGVRRIFNAHSYEVNPHPITKGSPAEPLPYIKDGTADYKVVCYLESWAIYRQDPMTTSPADVHPNGCTHVIFSFLGLDKTDLVVTVLDEEYEVVRGGFKAALAVKHSNPALKIMVAIGGWAEGGRQYSQMVSSPENRAKFIESVVSFMEKYPFDGFDLDWEYPGAVDRGGSSTDKENFAKLVEEMSDVFVPRGWLLSAAVPAAEFHVQNGYDVARLAKSLDFINVMTYDMHGTWDGYADHHAPLFRRPSIDQGATQNLNSEGALSYWISQGAPASKIIFGIPFYGRNYQLADAANSQPGAAIKGAGDVGEYTNEAGFVAYFEICSWLQDGDWDERLDEVGSPYAVKGDQWVGYDTIDSIKRKMEYIKDHGLGGAMIWAVGLDDVHGVCGSKRPLLRAVNEGLGRVPAQTTTTTTLRPTTTTIVAIKPPPGPPLSPVVLEPSSSGPFSCPGDGYFVKPGNCNGFYRCHASIAYSFDCPSGLHFDAKSSICNWPFLADCASSKSSSDLIVKKNNVPYHVFCYFSSWAWLRQGDTQFVPENIIPDTCTHVLYAYAGLDPTNLTIRSNDKWTDLHHNFYNRITALKQKNSDLTVMLALGGWTDSLGDTYSRLVSSAEARSKFVEKAPRFLERYGFDGLHLDWQYPVCWQADCSKGPASDRSNYALLAQELKREFDKKGLLLGVNVAGYPSISDLSYDAAQLAKNADFISVPAYDFHGSWESNTGHTAPLTGDGNDNVEASMKYWVAKGIPAQKLLMGIPFYGQSFTLATQATTSQQARIGVLARGAGNPGPATQQAGMLAYFEICSLIKQNFWMEENSAVAPYAYRGSQWVGYDNVASVQRKAEHIKAQGYAGAMVWAIDMDDFNNLCCSESFPLTKAIARVLGIRNDRQPVAGGNCERPKPPVTPPPVSLTTGYDSGESTTTPASTSPTTWWSPSSTTAATPAATTTTATTTTTTTATTTTTTTPPPSKPPVAPVVSEGSCEEGKFYPVKDDCGSFQRCTNGELQKNKCSPGLLWNAVASLCDWAENVKCNAPEKPKTTTETPTTTTTTKRPSSTTKPKPPSGGSGGCREGEYSRSKSGDCSTYQRCVNGQLVELKCPGGLYWNPQVGNCDWPYNVQCGDRNLGYRYNFMTIEK